MHPCTVCKKEFKTRSIKCYHVMEKHTFKNCIDTVCTFCEIPFKSPVQNKVRNFYNKKCEECRDLQVYLKTNDLVSGTFVYRDTTRYYVNKGTIEQVCFVYDCNHSDCNHDISKLVQCIRTKCNNCYEYNGLNNCERCREMNNRGKNKKRRAMKQFKEKLGGVCVDCGETDMFKLEFDHINPLLKNVQITRSCPSDWVQEEQNLQLLCGNCHRMKTYKDRKALKYEKGTKIIANIKHIIGGCQNCGWNHKDKHISACALDFDHIHSKIRNVSMCGVNSITNEIKKTRLLCRNCHEMVTCLQRGGKMADIYYTKNEIEEFHSKLMCEKIKLQQNMHVVKCVETFSSSQLVLQALKSQGISSKTPQDVSSKTPQDIPSNT